MAQTQAQQHSIGDLFGELSAELSELMRKEVALAKTEVREEASRAGRASAMAGATVLAAYLALLLASFAAAWGLAAFLPNGVGFLIVAVVYAAVAGFLAARAKKQWQNFQPKPDETIATIKEDVRWAKRQLH